MRLPSLFHASNDRGASCHGGSYADTSGLRLVAIVGCPNVGKSVLFNRLTGAYVTVSNYPGTTVEVSHGKGRIGGQEVGVVDTPGMYSLLPITEEERVARSILLRERPDVVIHMVDAKNLARMLPLTLQLIEAELPVILDVNLMDEAERLGVHVDVEALERALGVPVVATACSHGRGVDELKERIKDYVSGHHGHLRFRHRKGAGPHRGFAVGRVPPVTAGGGPATTRGRRRGSPTGRRRGRRAG